ncbi:MAG: CehA/McbA family metallohydrolase [Oscillospiraceae bacterium]|jgi:hypothetical protein|nr:CehA/McbA family metallohydrolase [Oscillospiraceae bacterium]
MEVKGAIRTAALTALSAAPGYRSASFETEPGEISLYLRWHKEHAPMFALAVLYDPEERLRLNKWIRAGETVSLGAEREDIVIGGVPGRIPAGQWEIRLYLPLLTDGNSYPDIYIERTAPDVQLEPGQSSSDSDNGVLLAGYSHRNTVNTAERWYKGDFHTHTILSDGKESVASATEKAERMGLDFYVPTEHNVMHTAWAETRMLIVPGIEVTGLCGHFNVFGLDSHPNGFYDPRNWESGFIASGAINDLLKICRSNGGVCSLNHPFLREWSWTIPDTPLDLFHAVEIINDPTYTYAEESNEKALAFWNRMLNDGRVICGIGGSDSHNLEDERYEGAFEPSIPGDPATWVYCKGLRGGKLLNSVRTGHIYVTRRGAKLNISGKADGIAVLPGNRVPVGANIELRAAATEFGSNSAITIQWIVNGKVCGEDRLLPSDSTASYGLRANGEYGWVRADLRSADGTLIGFVNPLRWGVKVPSLIRFEDAAAGIA